MRVGITGASGFIGSHLREELNIKEGVRVSACDVPKCDLLKPEATSAFVKGKDIIIHTAAVNRGTDAEVIVGSVVVTHNLLSAMERTKHKPKIIFLSSIHAKGDTVFGLSKRLTEVMLRDFSEQQGVPVTIFRITNVFGEGCRPFYNSVVATFCYQAAQGERLTVKDGKNNLRLIYIGDVVDVISREITTHRKHPLFFKEVSSRNIVSIADLARIIGSFRKLKDKKLLKSKFHKDLYRTYCSYVGSTK